MKKPTLAAIWPYLFLIYAAGVLLYPVILTREASFFVKQDNLHQAYPFYNKLAISLHKGYLPVWDANTFGGKSFAGELQAGIFYPPNILWCLLFGSLNGIDTFHLDLLVALHYVICLLGMYRLANVFKLNTTGSVAAALTFTFAGAVGARAAGQTCIFFGLTLLPWSVFFIASYYFRQKRRIYFVCAGLIAGLEVLAGHMQPFFHTILIVGIVVLFYELHSRDRVHTAVLKTFFNVFLVILFALLIALPQIYYSAEYMASCLRTVSGGVYIGPGQKVPIYIYSHWYIIKLANFGNFLSPTHAQPDDDNILYMGILPLMLVVLYMAWSKKSSIASPHRVLNRLLYIILAIGILSAMGYQTYFYLILYNIPFVNLVRQLGRYVILISFSVSLLTGLATTYIHALKASFAPSVQYGPYLAIGVTSIIFIDLLFNPVGYLPTKTPFYPDYFYGRNRIIDSLAKTYGKYRVAFDMRDYDLVRRNLGDLYPIQTKFGYGATINKPFSDFINARQEANLEINDLLNVRYVITDKNLDSGYIYKDSVQELRLYERTNWYPRYYWKRQLGLGGMEIERRNASSMRQLIYTDNYQKIAVNCSIPDTLIFSENDYPGWECFDNGKAIRIYKPKIGNYPLLFRAIALTQGAHKIEFLYNKVFHWF